MVDDIVCRTCCEVGQLRCFHRLEETMSFWSALIPDIKALLKGHKEMAATLATLKAALDDQKRAITDGLAELNTSVTSALGRIEADVTALKKKAEESGGVTVTDLDNLQAAIQETTASFTTGVTQQIGRIGAIDPVKDEPPNPNA